MSEVAQAIKQKRIGVEELLHAYLNRIEKYDGRNGLNTVCEINERALEQAKHMDSTGDVDNVAMFGLPVLIKDNIDVEGLHTTSGSLALADNIAIRDADIVSNLRRNGAIILGKTNMTEFANYTCQDMPNGYSSRGGQVRNAYNRENDPGGSSSGSAVAVSADFCAAAIGTDTSFSIVACATLNGVTGYKPPAGKLSPNGIIPIAKTLDSAGPIAHNLSDALMVYSCMCSTPMELIEATDPASLHIAINTFNRDIVSEAQLAKYAAVTDALQRDGGCVTEITQANTPHQKVVMRCEFRQGLEEYLAVSSAKHRTLNAIIQFYETYPDSMKYGISYLSEAANASITDDIYVTAIAERKRLRDIILEDLRGFDACLMMGPTNIMHFVGLPSVAIRLGMGDDHTPRGMILYGADERRLLSAALTLEKYCTSTVMPLLT